MSFRVAVGRFWTESHSFSPLLTNQAMFEAGLLVEGQAVLDKLRGTRSEVGGFLDVLDTEDVTILPTVAAQSMCGGPIERPLWAMIRDRLLAGLANAQPLDGVLLSLHGATVAEGEDDCCGDLLARVRALLGPTIPVIVTLDMHGNPTPQMVANATAIIAYKTYPHHDFHERGVQAANILMRTLRGDVRPVMAVAGLPLALGFATAIQLELIAQGIALEERGEILACSVMSTHTGLDVANIQALTALVVTNNDPAQAQRIAQDLMWQAWGQRHRITIGMTPRRPLAEALDQALAMPPGTVVMADQGDAVTAGFPGDNAELIAQLLARGSKARACLMINDPALVQRAMAAGVGNRVVGPIGGRWGEHYYKPVAVNGHVRLLFDGVLPQSHEARPSHLAVSNTSMGLTAVVQVGETITVVATSIPVASTEPTVFRAVGVEPADYRLVVVKAVLQHRDHFGSLAVGFVDIADYRFGDDVHAWAKRQPKLNYPYHQYSDAEIKQRLGIEA